MSANSLRDFFSVPARCILNFLKDIRFIIKFSLYVPHQSQKYSCSCIILLRVMVFIA